MYEERIILIFIVLLIIISIIILRFRIFTNRGELKYGSYSDPVLGECVTKNNPSKCTDTGTQKSTSYCIPNSETGLGCLDENGNHTFESKVETLSCVPHCRVSIWSEKKIGICELEEPQEDVCLNELSLGNRIISKVCIPNDANGTNMCTYERAPASNDPIPSTCKLNGFGSTVSCEVGTVLEINDSCMPLENKFQCGEYKVGIEDPQPCQRIELNSQSEICRDQNGNFYQSDTDILKEGWYSQPMRCLDMDGKTAYGCVQPECVTSKDAYSRVYDDSETPVILCNSLSCVQPCTYFPKELKSNWDSSIQKLVLSFNNMISGNYMLGINNIPCPGIGGEFINGIQQGNNSVLGDCYGNPNLPLETTPSLLINYSNISVSPTAYGLSNLCQSSEEIVKMSSYYLIFLPTREMTKPNQLYANINAIIGKDYIGVLEQKGCSIEWKQAELGTRSHTEYLIVYNKQKKLYKLTFADGSEISINTNEGKTRTLNSVRFVNQSQDPEQFQDLLIHRQERDNELSCNVMYS